MPRALTHRFALPLAAVLLATLLAGPTTAQDAPPFPEYPAFRPEQGPSGDQHRYDLFFLDVLEVAPTAVGVPAALNGFYRVGTDYTRLWLRARGEGLLAEAAGDVEAYALASRLVSPFFEAVAGLRLDTEFGEGAARARPQFAVGVMGLAPYWFEVEALLFASAAGDLAARFDATYDLLVTQRLVLEPEAEVNVALQAVEDWGVGRGLNDIELGLRLRYEVVRELAPYVGVTWRQRFGGAADLAAEARETLVVIGLRLWR